MCLTFAMVKNASRRHFLRTAPAAAVAGLALTDKASFAAAIAADPVMFQAFTAAQLAEDGKALMAKPGNNNLVDMKTCTMVMTTEGAKTPKEFEWHEGRDHIVQILDGATIYEVGGTPKGGHSKSAGEWNSPESEGATRLVMKKGDMLTIPRGTPHKRTTETSVTLILISSQGMLM